MSLHLSTSIFKVTCVVFITTSIVYAIKFFESKEENTKLKTTILIDKKTYANDLNEIFNRYDSEVIKNITLEDLYYNQNLIKTNADKIKKGNYNFRSRAIYVNEDNSHQFTIDSLKMVLFNKNIQHVELSNRLQILINKNKDLNKQSDFNKVIIANNQNLTATNVFANGIKIVSNNIIETKRFNNTEQIKVCFTLMENKATIKGNKDIFIQIINPKNKVVSKNGDFVEMEDKSLYYSAKTYVYYDNEELDVCVFVDSNKSDILKGDYGINILSGTKIIGSTTFSLK